MSQSVVVARLRIEPLDRKIHDRAAFSCGQITLDNYLKNTATRQQDQNLTRVKVGCLDQSNEVISFYAMNAHSLNVSALDEIYRKRFPRYESIPAAYLSMVAVHVNYQGGGIGSRMMADAMKQVLSAGEHIGVHFLVLDALNEEAAKLYLRLGFERLSSIP